MRGGILFLGIMLLLIGAALYFVLPVADANVQYARDSADDAVTMGVLPIVGLVALGLGALLTLLGIFAPAPRRYVADREMPVERTRTVVKDHRGRVRRVETEEIRRE